MHNISSQVLTSQTLCWVWVLTLKDVTTLGFTDHDKPLIFKSISCEPEAGFAPGETDARLGFSVTIGAVQGGLTSDVISAEDIRTGRFDGAKIECYRVDWDSIDNYVHISTGYIGEIRQKGNAFEAEWLGEGVRLERSTGRVFARICDAEFGDTRCGLDVGDFSQGTTCPRTFAACRDQFSNTLNFRGFPYLIGDDAMVAGPKEGERRDGGSRYS